MNWDFIYSTILVIAGIWFMFNQSKESFKALDPTTKWGKIAAYSVLYGLSIFGTIMLLIIYLDGYCGIHIIKQMTH